MCMCMCLRLCVVSFSDRGASGHSERPTATRASNTDGHGPETHSGGRDPPRPSTRESFERSEPSMWIASAPPSPPLFFLRLPSLPFCTVHTQKLPALLLHVPLLFLLKCECNADEAEERCLLRVVYSTLFLGVSRTSVSYIAEGHQPKKKKVIEFTKARHAHP
jgi:hypothetical protein